MKDLPSGKRTEEFLRLYNQEQRKIYAYIRTLLYSPEEVEDVFQETCIALWRSFDEFEPGTDFGAWARTTARFRVLAHAKKRTSDKHVFATETIELLAEEIEEDSPVIAKRSAQLDHCLRKLPEADRRILVERYFDGRSAAQMASDMGRPLGTLYKSLRRIRRLLLECVEMNIRREEHTA
ncbi:sigma-70 family RNA polymerase sigma factor [Aeoliella mucimassa]|uniref:ECF RNA polymerase sigma factor SigW n=1 Tax=Aeoliella mucimassa TaxID=2527972 RepID=A0A518AVG1_9BACT|nr:sigma-70 family RNA polymerase sigma factor [Aeoliella mucimassa]QDU58701.1 ECF RNA polymerase sigma factor SigW [Aeoliella mucimassa]